MREPGESALFGRHANVPEGAEEGLDEKTVDGKGWSG